jgi:predicted DNA-binding transcriptional regulator YafY
MKKQEKRLRRALYLVPYVTKHEGGVRLSELAELVGATPSELEKEIRALLQVGVPDGCDHVNIYIDGKGPSAVVSALPCRLLNRPPRLSTQEGLALLIGAEAVKSTGIHPYDVAIARAATKIRAMLGQQDKGQSEGDRIVLAEPGSEKRETLASLSRACRDHRTVEMDYASVASQRRSNFRVEPYGLLNHTGAWYVLGRSLTHKEERIFVFKVERILGVTILDMTFTVPKDFDVKRYRGERMFISDWKPAKVTLRLRGPAVERMRDWFTNPERQRDGSIVVYFKDHITGWLAAWVLRQGEGVEVIEPVELREWVLRLAKKVVACHAD